MARVASVLLIAALVGGCCRRDLPPYPPDHHQDLNYRLPLYGVTTGGGENVLTRVPSPRGSFAVAGIAGEASADRGFITLRMSNVGSAPVTIDWGQARFVDESGMAHEVYAYDLSKPPPEPHQIKRERLTISPGRRAFVIVAPTSKTYLVLVDGCREVANYHEPLVPWTYRGRSRSELHGWMDALKDRKARVHLVVPLEVDGSTREVSFSFQVESRIANRSAAPDE